MTPFSLQGRQILIVGASSGIGRATAEAVSEMGGKVVAVGRNSMALNDCISALKSDGHNQIVCDITDETSVNEMVNCLDKIDGLVYCAGILQSTSTKFITSEVLKQQFDTNYFGATLLMAKLQMAKKLKKGASIVFISSAAAEYAIENGNAVYSSTKAALQAYARTLAKELLSRHIRVNCIAPGMVKTTFLSNFEMDEDEMLRNEQKYPFGFGEPKDVAYTAIYLLSDAAKWMTGSVIHLDGGLSIS